MVPARVVELESFPLTPSGKIDTVALDHHLPPVQAPPVAPRNSPASALADDQEPLVDWWARCISELVGVSVDADADFFSVGGHSLMATEALARGRDALGVDLRVQDFLSAPTARGLAELSLQWAEATLLDIDVHPVHPVGIRP